MTTPTPAQIEVAMHVRTELRQIVDDWVKDGADVQDVIAALANTAADTITAAYGAEKVAPWFIGMAVNASKLPKGHH
jgi:hypothetical protein